MKDDWDFPEDPLAALGAGDKAPFEAFVREKSRSLVGFFARKGVAMDVAEDLTQEVFLRLYRHAARYRPEQRFAPFCLRVARNVWIDHSRRRGSRPGREAEVGEGAGGEALGMRAEPDPYRVAEQAEEHERLHLALERLGPHHKDVFELAGIQGLEYAQVSDLLGIPVGTVKSRMFYAIRRLREALDEDLR